MEGMHRYEGNIMFLLKCALLGMSQELKHQLEDLKEQVIQDKEFGWANEAQPAPPPQPPTSRDVCDLAVAAAALSQPLIDQVADLKQQLFQCQTKLQEREAKARKYKDAVRALQVGCYYFLVSGTLLHYVCENCLKFTMPYFRPGLPMLS